MERTLQSRGFARNVVTLMTGTTIAQAIPIALSPILTRIYKPEDFGILALYIALSAIVGTIATARYELAIMLPKDEESAINVVALSIGMAFVTSFVVLIIVVMFNSPIAKMLGNSEIGNWLYFIPLSILLTGIYQSLNYWANRKSQYGSMSSSRVVQSGATVATQCIVGLAGGGPTGLVGGSLTGQMLATAQLAKATFGKNRFPLRCITFYRCKDMALRYISHPKYLVISHGISSAYGQLPVFVFSSLYSMVATGHFSLATRMVALPSTLIANAVGDVFRQRAAEDFRKHGRFDDVLEKTVVRTALLGLPFFLIFFFLSEDIFAFVFSEDWRIAGEQARILAISSYFGFVFTPIDKGALITEKLNYILNWHLFRFLGMLFAAGSAWYFKLEQNDFLIAVTACNVFFYCLDGFFEYRFSKGL